uniref:Uncharacterized protein n=1 Tax=Capitella teleta TaxID=283909 RepID=X2ANI6_CAPTE
MVGGTVNKDTHRYIIQRISNFVEMLCDWMVSCHKRNLIRGSCCILGVLEKSLLSVLVCFEFGLSKQISGVDLRNFRLRIVGETQGIEDGIRFVQCGDGLVRVVEMIVEFDTSVETFQIIVECKFVYL